MRVLIVLLIVSIYSVPAAAQSEDSWARAQALEPGSEILLTVARTQAVQRYVVAVDDNSLRVLNLADSSFPGSLAETLRSIASEHPEYFARAASDGTVLVGRVRLTKTGVFVGNDRVGDLQRLVETHARPDVSEIARRRRGRGFWGHLGPLGGYFVGGMAGGLLAGVACQAVSGRDRCDTGAFLIGMVGGGVAGGTYGGYAARRENEEIVYRATPGTR
jgi:hypothetical protein